MYIFYANFSELNTDFQTVVQFLLKYSQEIFSIEILGLWKILLQMYKLNFFHFP